MTEKKQNVASEPEEQAVETAVDEQEAAVPEPDETGQVPDDLARVTVERDDYLDHLRRLQAEFDNYRRRVQRDKEELRLRASEAVVESLLPVVDNLGRALAAAEQEEDSRLVAGVRLVADQLRGTLIGHGLAELDVQPGAMFDPAVHEAVLTQASESEEEGTVLQVVERGYLLHGKLLRPAKVIVAR
jgi:molecular chaperone GrpE